MNAYLNHVVSGMHSINEILKTNSKVSKIYNVPSEDPSEMVYQTLLRSIIRHLDQGKEFKKSNSNQKAQE